MTMTLPRERKSAAYRSVSTSELIGLTRSSSAGNGLAFGEDVPPPRSAPLRAARISPTLPHPFSPAQYHSAFKRRIAFALNAFVGIDSDATRAPELRAKKSKKPPQVFPGEDLDIHTDCLLHLPRTGIND